MSNDQSNPIKVTPPDWDPSIEAVQEAAPQLIDGVWTQVWEKVPITTDQIFASVSISKWEAYVKYKNSIGAQ